ncbi:hypothetical protein QE152_g4567 [Popillia japonica]|uniref:Uncharacterized protein n=1 Tax=Popillia japonica TaxID=7064 RepID=A0AAW1N0D9_POPJA
MFSIAKKRIEEEPWKHNLCKGRFGVSQIVVKKMFSIAKKRIEEEPWKHNLCSVCHVFGGGASSQSNEQRKDNLEDGELDCDDCIRFAKELENIDCSEWEGRRKEVRKDKVIEKINVLETNLLSQSIYFLTNLLSQSIYFLNKSCSKWLCIGLVQYITRRLDANLFFEPIVKIVGIKKQCVSFTEEEWLSFLECEMELKQYFRDSSLVFQVVERSNARISFECFDGVKKILKLEKDKECVYLSYEGVEQLWKLDDLVKCRIQQLKELQYVKFYKKFVNSLIVVEGEVISEIEKILEKSTGFNVCITKELMFYNFNKILSDIKLCRTT